MLQYAGNVVQSETGTGWCSSRVELGGRYKGRVISSNPTGASDLISEFTITKAAIIVRPHEMRTGKSKSCVAVS